MLTSFGPRETYMCVCSLPRKQYGGFTALQHWRRTRSLTAVAPRGSTAPGAARHGPPGAPKARGPTARRHKDHPPSLWGRRRACWCRAVGVRPKATSAGDTSGKTSTTQRHPDPNPRLSPHVLATSPPNQNSEKPSHCQKGNQGREENQQ